MLCLDSSTHTTPITHHFRPSQTLKVLPGQQVPIQNLPHVRTFEVHALSTYRDDYLHVLHRTLLKGADFLHPRIERFPARRQDEITALNLHASRSNLGSTTPESGTLRHILRRC
jgi:hypothetical protein